MSIHRPCHCFSWKDIPASWREGSHYRVWTCLEPVPAEKQDSGGFLKMHFSCDSKCDSNMSVFSGIRTQGCSVPADSSAGDAIPSSVCVVHTVCGFREGFICSQIQASASEFKENLELSSSLLAPIIRS